MFFWFNVCVLDSKLKCYLNLDTDSVGVYIGEGATSVVLSDAIFDKKAMAQENFVLINHLACSAAIKGNEAVRSELIMALSLSSIAA